MSKSGPMRKMVKPVSLPLKAKFLDLGLTSYEKLSHYLMERGVTVSGSYLSMLDRGKREPSVPTARSIAKALDMDLSEIIGT